MLTGISIRNLVTVESLQLDLHAGMSVLTGETGAGKSILIDALGLVLGDKSDNSLIRHGKEKAEITAEFDLAQLPGIRNWLESNDLDDAGECLLRRTISTKGRSRAYINGSPAPLQSLRAFGERLVDIHGQHEHQSLLRSSVQRQLLDDFGVHHALLAKVADLHRDWQAARIALDAAIAAGGAGRSALATRTTGKGTETDPALAGMSIGVAAVSASAWN